MPFDYNTLSRKEKARHEQLRHHSYEKLTAQIKDYTEQLNAIKRGVFPVLSTGERVTPIEKPTLSIKILEYRIGVLQHHKDNYRELHIEGLEDLIVA
jgi:hypothetical protein